MKILTEYEKDADGNVFAEIEVKLNAFQTVVSRVEIRATNLEKLEQIGKRFVGYVSGTRVRHHARRLPCYVRKNGYFLGSIKACSDVRQTALRFYVIFSRGDHWMVVEQRAHDIEFVFLPHDFIESVLTMPCSTLRTDC